MVEGEGRGGDEREEGKWNREARREGELRRDGEARIRKRSSRVVW